MLHDVRFGSKIQYVIVDFDLSSITLENYMVKIPDPLCTHKSALCSGYFHTWMRLRWRGIAEV